MITYTEVTTERKLAEAALRESETTLRGLIESNPETLFMLDTRGKVLAASKVAAQRLNKSLEEIIGADAFSLVPPRWAKTVSRFSRKCSLPACQGGLKMSEGIFTLISP